MTNPFKLIMLSAGFENGGNVLHRHFDGHESCHTYAFESMIGTPTSSNLLTPAVPFRYAYPSFDSELTPEQAYHQFFDEEAKTYLRTPWRSKFKDCGMVMDEAKRIEAFKYHSRTFKEAFPFQGSSAFEPYNRVYPLAHSRASYVEAYFRSFSDAWENSITPKSATHHVGYLPGIVMDADKLFSDFPDAHMVHVIRNPWSAFRDTLKRPFPLSLERFCQVWNTLHSTALTYRRKYAGQFHTVRYEDLIDDVEGEMRTLLTKLGLPWSVNATFPSFNGRNLSDSVKPWGTLTTITPEANLATSLELTEDQIEAIAIECYDQIKAHGYTGPHSGSLT